MPVRLLLVCTVVLCALSMGLRQSFALFLAPITAAQGSATPSTRGFWRGGASSQSLSSAGRIWRMLRR